jgi:transposase-like protein
MDTKGKETPASTGLNWRNKPRRTFTPEERLAIVRECDAPGVSVAEVAQRNRVNTNLLFKWRRLYTRGLLPAAKSSTALVPVTVSKSKKRRPAKRPRRARRKPAPAAGAIEIEMADARIILHGTVSEANLGAALRALARK